MSDTLTSSVAGAKAALVAAIRARPEAAGVLVTYGFPNDLSHDAIIAVMSVPGGRHTVRRGRKREEAYSIDVICSAFSGSDNQQTVTERALDLKEIVEAAVAEQPSLGGAVLSAVIGSDFQVREAIPRTLERNGRATEVDLQVDCEFAAYA